MENLNLRHRCYTFEGVGKIVYDPYRKGAEEPWTAVIEVDYDLMHYCRNQFLKHFNVQLLEPNWRPHISMLRGQIDHTKEMKKLWKTMDSKRVKFVYTNEMFWNEKHVWINTYCPEFFELRDLMGLSATHKNNQVWGHVTIGKFRKEGQMGTFVNYKDPLPKGY